MNDSIGRRGNANLENARARHAEYVKRIELSNNIAIEGWKSLALINGGAIVVLFTAVGGKSISLADPCVKFSFLLFAMGLLCVLLSQIIGYKAQSLFEDNSAGNSEEQLPATKYENWGIGFAIGSIAAFVGGSWFALAASPIQQKMEGQPASTAVKITVEGRNSFEATFDPKAMQSRCLTFSSDARPDKAGPAASSSLAVMVCGSASAAATSSPARR